MANDDGVLGTADDFVSLYRRYRPGKFSELRGQEHVVRALRTAVKDGHVAHAYLFSGPRGTGKTSTARILAKALNCLAPVDGEPCGVCASCSEITRGTSMDVTELDAASNNGVEAIRDLIAHAALGSPGRSKVYIIDEVHMLSTAAANALLKTLEEPPGHVVFVLATTDPQKVPPTIRSRTQHLEFRLLGAETLEGLLRDVRDDAGLGLDDAIVSLAVRKGKGSARDALSALDQVAASGESTESRPELSSVVDGLCDEDAGATIVALSTLQASGWGPQQLATELIDELRQAFLIGLAPDLAQVTGADRDRLQEQISRLGLARVVRCIELLGRAQVEMRDAPDAQVLLEVAVVRAARTDLEGGSTGLADRITRLERKIQELSHGAPPVAPPAAKAVRPTPQVDLAPGAKASLGAFKKAAPETQAPGDTPTAEPEETPAPQAAPATAPATERNATDVSRDDVEQVWRESVLPGITARARSLYLGGSVSNVENGMVTFVIPNDAHRAKCSEHAAEVESALALALGAPMTLDLTVAEATRSQRTKAERIEEAGQNEEIIDVEHLEEASVNAASSVAEAKILDAFPGAIEEEG